MVAHQPLARLALAMSQELELFNVYLISVKNMSFGAGIEFSEFPKASSSKLNKVVFCLHGTY